MVSLADDSLVQTRANDLVIARIKSRKMDAQYVHPRTPSHAPPFLSYILSMKSKKVRSSQCAGHRAPPYITPSSISLSLSSYSCPLYRQIRIPPRATNRLQCLGNIRPNNGNAPNKAGYRGEEVAEQDEDAIEFDYEAEEGPAHEDERDA